MTRDPYAMKPRFQIRFAERCRRTACRDRKRERGSHRRWSDAAKRAQFMRAAIGGVPWMHTNAHYAAITGALRARTA